MKDPNQTIQTIAQVPLVQCDVRVTVLYDPRVDSKSLSARTTTAQDKWYMNHTGPMAQEIEGTTLV